MPSSSSISAQPCPPWALKMRRLIPFSRQDPIGDMARWYTVVETELERSGMHVFYWVLQRRRHHLRLQFCPNDEQMKMSSFLCSGIWTWSQCLCIRCWLVWFIWGTYRMQKEMKDGSDSVQRISNHATASSPKQHVSIHIILQNSSAAYKTIKSLLPQAARNNWRAPTIQTNSCQYGKWGRRWDSHSAAEWGDLEILEQGKNAFLYMQNPANGAFSWASKSKIIMWL